MKTLFALFIISISSLGLTPADTSVEDWRLKKEKDGIRLFVRDIVDSNLKEVKIEMSFLETDIAKILEVVKDSDRYTEWVYKCSASSAVEKISAHEDISYYKFDFPWPFNDRDAFMKSKIEVEPNFSSATINTTIAYGYDPPASGIIRIKEHFNQWKFKQAGPDRVDLTYFAKSHPAGSIPDWLVNLAVDHGPMETLAKLRSILGKQ